MNIFRGVVTRVTSEGVFVIVASKYPGVELGPCEQIQTVTEVSVTDQQSNHRHDIPMISTVLQAGDLVAVSRFDDGDFMILGRRV